MCNGDERRSRKLQPSERLRSILGVDLEDHSRRGVLIGLAAALSFGVAAPFAKLLLEEARPQLLAGLLYLGAFIVFGAVAPFRRHSSEARLRRADAPRLLGLVLAGGVLAPVLLLIGLERVSGSTGSLLLNLEGPFTVVIGLAMFREQLGRRATLGAAAVFTAGLLLALGGPSGSADAVGALCIAGACLLWGLDNNLTQSLTLRDPFSIVTVKAGTASIVNLALALALGSSSPSFLVIVGALGLGALSYGVSIVLDTYALRLLGAAREAAVFATAPFVGAIVAIPVLSEMLSLTDVVAGVVMAAGIALMLAEKHAHEHAHASVEHEHAHVHDEHHQHDHDPGVVNTEPHSHVHRHKRLVHAHPHVSDLHHRHPH
jgi:drug/metabolite transporter (DMT)-like permease